MVNQIVEIILEVILIILGLYLAFFKSYFSEKGKNLATVEDIEKITNIVEAVKRENNIQLESMKTEMLLLSKTQMVVYDDERKAIIEFIESIINYYELNTNIPYVDDSKGGLIYLPNQIETIEVNFAKVQIARSKLSLFCFNEEILNKVTPIIIALTKLKSETGFYRIQALGIIERRKNLSDNLSKQPELFDKIKVEHENELEVNRLFNKKVIELYGEYHPLFTDLIQVCKVYLKAKKANN